MSANNDIDSGMVAFLAGLFGIVGAISGNGWMMLAGVIFLVIWFVDRRYS